MQPFVKKCKINSDFNFHSDSKQTMCSIVHLIFKLSIYRSCFPLLYALGISFWGAFSFILKLNSMNSFNQFSNLVFALNQMYFLQTKKGIKKNNYSNLHLYRLQIIMIIKKSALIDYTITICIMARKSLLFFPSLYVYLFPFFL
jgi:hypothetical protein